MCVWERILLACLPACQSLAHGSFSYLSVSLSLFLKNGFSVFVLDARDEKNHFIWFSFSHVLHHFLPLSASLSLTLKRSRNTWLRIRFVGSNVCLDLCLDSCPTLSHAISIKLHTLPFLIWIDTQRKVEILQFASVCVCVCDSVCKGALLMIKERVNVYLKSSLDMWVGAIERERERERERLYTTEWVCLLLNWCEE